MRDTNPGPPDCESDMLTTRPRCVLRKCEMDCNVLKIIVVQEGLCPLETERVAIGFRLNIRGLITV